MKKWQIEKHNLHTVSKELIRNGLRYRQDETVVTYPITLGLDKVNYTIKKVS